MQRAGRGAEDLRQSHQESNQHKGGLHNGGCYSTDEVSCSVQANEQSSTDSLACAEWRQKCALVTAVAIHYALGLWCACDFSCQQLPSHLGMKATAGCGLDERAGGLWWGATLYSLDSWNASVAMPAISEPHPPCSHQTVLCMCWHTL